MNNEDKKRELVKSVRSREAASNMVVAKVLSFISAFAILVGVLFNSYFSNTRELLRDISLYYNPLICGSICGLCILLKGKGKWQKHVLLFIAAYCILCLDVMSGFKSRILYSIPMVLSMRYYDKSFIFFSYLVCVFILGCSVYINAYMPSTSLFIDLNTLYLENPETVTLEGFLNEEIIALGINSPLTFRFGVMLTFVPNFIFLSAFLLVIMEIMKNNQMIILKLNDEVAKEKEREAELVSTKTKVILSQVKPHFIYNALTSIAYLCTKNPKKAKELTLNFSNYLRSNLDSIADDAVDIIDFDSELKHVENYLNIELVRFEDTLKVEYDIETNDFSLPSLTVQPLVENAVKHGVCKKEDGGKVIIQTRKIEGYYQVKVIDDGVGFNVDDIDKDGKVHIGLNSIRQRLQMCNGTLTIDSEIGKGTVSTILIPDGETL